MENEHAENDKTIKMRKKIKQVKIVNLQPKPIVVKAAIVVFPSNYLSIKEMVEPHLRAVV